MYLPTLGRFAQVDPVEGGTDNAYVYVNDPINDFDITDTIGWKKWFSARRKNMDSLAKKEYAAYTKATNWCSSRTACNVGFFLLTMKGSGKGGIKGGLSASRLVFKTEHASRHLKGTGLNTSAVENAISRDIRAKQLTGSVPWKNTVEVNGRMIEYRTKTLTNGTINIGTYFQK